MSFDSLLLLAHGGPDKIEDIPPFLKHIVGNRPIRPQVLEEITARYKLIGGKSPLKESTERVAKKLTQKVNMPVYIGMRHWHPFIGDSIQKMTQDSVRRTLVICLAPHFSQVSIGAYQQAVLDSKSEIDVKFVRSFHNNPLFISMWANLIQPSLGMTETTRVIFTAHSLPKKTQEQGDPYSDQVYKSAQLIARKSSLNQDSWHFCWQSAGQTGDEWLGPSLEEMIPVFAAQGVRQIVVAPIGFVSDHVEILYDIDIAAREVASKHHINLLRTPMPNDCDAFIEVLANVSNTLKYDV